MSLKQKFIQLLECYYGHHEATVKRLETDLKQHLYELAETERALSVTRAEADQAVKRMLDVEAQNQILRDGIIPRGIHKLADEHRNRYPTHRVLYGGFQIKLKDRIERPQMAVQDFIHVLHSHREWCKLHGFSLEEYLLRYPKSDFGEVVNILMFDIFKRYVNMRKYLTDLLLFGVDEHWALLAIIWYLKIGDCEDTTNELMALFEAAGLSGPLRSFYWNACGMTHSDVGHSTLYAYDFRDGFYRHLETTLSRVRKTDFHQLPASNSLQDRMNLKYTWMSFNSDVARHRFNTDAAAESFEKRSRYQDIRIEGVA